MDRVTIGKHHLTLAAVVSLLALAVTCLVFVWTPAGQEFDTALLPRAERGGGYEQQTELLTPAKYVLDLFGDTAVLAVLLVCVLVIGVVTKRPWAGAAGVGVVLGSVLTARFLKEVVVRPDLGVYGSSTHNSFPSGHVAVATGLFLAFLLVLPTKWLVLPGALAVVVIGSATMITGWHRLSDIIGAVLLAVALYCVAAALTAGRANTPANGNS
jgi:membrane-associated phospholipid phosphatase